MFRVEFGAGGGLLRESCHPYFGGEVMLNCFSILLSLFVVTDVPAHGMSLFDTEHRCLRLQAHENEKKTNLVSSHLSLFSRHSLYTQVTLAQNTSVYGPWPTRGFGSMFASCKKKSTGILVLASCRLVSSGPPALMEKRCVSLTLKSVA